MSPQIEAILGYPPEAFIDDPELWPRLIHPEDRTIDRSPPTPSTGRRSSRCAADYRMIAARRLASSGCTTRPTR